MGGLRRRLSLWIVAKTRGRCRAYSQRLRGEISRQREMQPQETTPEMPHAHPKRDRDVVKVADLSNVLCDRGPYLRGRTRRPRRYP